MTLRAKLAFVLAALAASAVAAVGYLSYNVTRDRSIREIDASLTTANRFDPDMDGRRPGPGGIGKALYSLQRINSTGTLAISSGDVVLPIDALDIKIAAGEADDVTRTVRLEDGTSYRVRTNHRRQGGALQIGRDLSEVNRVLHDLSERLLLLGAMVVAVAGIAGWFIAKGLTRGLRNLTHAAAEVSTTGRFDVAIKTKGRDEVGQLGTALSSMLGALDRSREEQRRLVQDAGHELRTPLTSVRTNVDVLRKHTNMPADMRARVLDDLDSEVAELSSLVEEVVAVASGSAADEPRSLVPLAGVVEAAADRIRRRYDREIVTETDNSEATMQRNLFERAVTNLLDNAAKFDQSTEAIQISSINGRIAVRDHGPGIAAADLTKVFDRFYRSVETRSKPGSGLGLAIVTEVANSHGGATFANNHPTGGAVVGFQVPVTKPAPQSLGNSLT